MKIKAVYEIVGASKPFHGFAHSRAPPNKPRRFLECFALPRHAANHVNADAEFLARCSGAKHSGLRLIFTLGARRMLRPYDNGMTSATTFEGACGCFALAWCAARPVIADADFLARRSGANHSGLRLIFTLGARRMLRPYDNGMTSAM
jgi:hypothetical protein